MTFSTLEEIRWRLGDHIKAQQAAPHASAYGDGMIAGLQLALHVLDDVSNAGSGLSARSTGKGAEMSYLKVKEMLRLVSELEDKIDESPDVDLEGASAEDICDLVNTVTGVIGNLAFMVGNMSGIYRRPPKKPGRRPSP